MKKTTMIAAAAAVGLALTGAASASTFGAATIDDIGGGVSLNAGDLSSVVFGDSWTQEGHWTDDSLAAAHSSLIANRGSDVDGDPLSADFTNDVVTVLMARVDTNGSDAGGMSTAFLTLFDREEAGASFTDLNAGFNLSTSATFANGSWVNDSNELLIAANASSGQSNIEWDANGKGDGFAWTDLTAGDTLTYNFQPSNSDNGVANVTTFQFLSWNESTEKWDQIFVGESNDSGNFNFDVNIVPLPPAAFAGLAGLGLAAVARRRFGK